MIYLDNNATTPADPEVVEAMLPYLSDKFGNASSRHHAFGWEAEEAVDQARDRIAQLIHVDPSELIFTSGATESNNLAIKGVFELYARKGNHIITVASEHKAVLDVCDALRFRGAEITVLPVNRQGLVDADQVLNAIRNDTILVSTMWANNETGVLQPMKELGSICAEQGVLLMSDATQAVGKIPVDPKKVGVHLMSFSAHKMYGPKGVGALYICSHKPRVKVRSQIHGGGHQQGLRSGTLNVPGIVGFGKAAILAVEQMSEEALRLQSYRSRLEQLLLNEVEEVQINGSETNRLPHVSSLSFKHVEGEQLMMSFNQEIAVSSGSACTSASLDPSHVLTAMGMSETEAHSTLRISFGRFNREIDVDRAAKSIRKGVLQLRAESPIWEMYKDGVDLSS